MGNRKCIVTGLIALIMTIGSAAHAGDLNVATKQPFSMGGKVNKMDGGRTPVDATKSPFEKGDSIHPEETPAVMPNPISPTATPVATVDLTFLQPATTSAFSNTYTFGIPFALTQNIRTDKSLFATVTADGKIYPAHIDVTSTYHWNNRALRWALIKANLPVDARNLAESVPGQLSIYDENPGIPEGGIPVTQNSKFIRINNGTVRVAINKIRGTIIDRLDFDNNGDGLFDDDETVFRAGDFSNFTDEEEAKKWGTYWVGRFETGESTDHVYASAATAPDKVELESQNSQEVIVRIEGAYARVDNPSKKSGRYVARVSVSRESGVRVQFTHIFTENTAKYVGNPNHTFDDGYMSTCYTENSQNFEKECLTEQPQTFFLKDLALAFPVQSDGKWSLARDDASELSGNVSAIPTKIVQNGANVYLKDGKQESGRIAGALWTDGAALAVKNFWELFPAGLEISDEGMKYYLWTPTPERHDPQNPTYENVYHNYFVHEGPALTFWTPNKVSEIWPVFNEGELPHYPQLGNAEGVSVTADILLAFGDTAVNRVQAYASDNAPLILPDTHQLAKSGTFGKLSVATDSGIKDRGADVSFIDDAENYLGTTADKYLTMPEDMDEDGNYGRFNYGDTHTKLLIESEDPSVSINWSPYRTWAQFHHGLPRIFGILSARDPDPRLFRYFHDNIRHLVDVNMAHTDNYVAGRNYESQICTGGMRDYKGIVPWFAGCRGKAFEYNTVIDAQLWAFYRTGDGRIKDVLREQLDLVFENLTENTDYSEYAGRDAEGPLNALLDVYEAVDPQGNEIWTDTATGFRWNQILKTVIHNSFGNYVKKMLEESKHIAKDWYALGFGPFVPEGYVDSSVADYTTANWTNWIEHGLHLAGEQRSGFVLTEEIVANLKSLAKVYGDALLDQRQYCPQHPINVLSNAYSATGDTNYLTYGIKLVEQQVRAIFEPDIEFFSQLYDFYETNIATDQSRGNVYFGEIPATQALSKDEWAQKAETVLGGMPVDMVNTVMWSFFTQRLPGFLADLDEANVDSADDIVVPFRVASDTLSPDEIFYLRAYIKVENGQSAKLNLNCYTGTTDGEANPEPKVLLYKKGNSSPEILTWGKNEAKPDGYDVVIWPEYPLVKTLSSGGEYRLEVKGTTDTKRAACYLPVSNATFEVVDKCLSDPCGVFDVSDNVSLYFPWDGSNDETDGNDIRVTTGLLPTVLTLTSPSGDSTAFNGFNYFPRWYIDMPQSYLQGNRAEVGIWRLDLGPILDEDGNGAIRVYLPNIGNDTSDGQYFFVSQGRYFEPSF